MGKICKNCDGDMGWVAGCAASPCIHNGKRYARIKVGDKGDFYEGIPDAECFECFAEYGHYHHPGCDCETCPVCGCAWVICDCGPQSAEKYKRRVV
jgi:hypothetical protein